ncbi:MAG: YfiR family protein, partial [candidate division WOR-3 bacterium]
SEIKVGVVYYEAEGEKTADGFLEGFGGLKKKEVAGIPVSAKKLKGGTDLSGYEVIYIASGDRERIKKVLAVASKAITVTPYPNMVNLGIVLGLGEKDGNPKIWVNLNASRAVGCNFSSDFLRLAEVVE